MKIQLNLNVKEEQWLKIAIINGFVRINPRKPWTEKDKKEAVRFALELQIKDWER